MSPDKPEKRRTDDVLNPPPAGGAKTEQTPGPRIAAREEPRKGRKTAEGRKPESRRTESAGERRAATGAGGSELERRAAKRLAGELRATGREVESRELAVRAGQGPVVAVHAALAVAGSLLGLLSPIAGAAVLLFAGFSFYGERGLGLFLLSRLLPRRRITNVITPPLGPAWESEVDTILVAGYDAPPPYPAGEWLARRFGGRLTTDRLVFWAGMVPTFAALMLRLATVDGFWVQLIQIVAAAVLLTGIAAQIDRRLKGEVLGVEDDLAAARDLIQIVRELEHEDGDAGIAVCLFGAESDGAAGAEAFYSDPRLKVRSEIAVIGLVPAAPDGKPEATGREGDLTSVSMEFGLAGSSPLKPHQVAIRRDTAAGRARRRGARATTLVGRGETGMDLIFDTIETAAPTEETP